MKSPVSFVLLCVLAACGGTKDGGATKAAPATIVLGDCVDTPATLFVSGPRPVAPGDEVDPGDGGASGSGGSGSGGYGTIGHGGGYGVSGNAGTRHGDVPTVSIGQPAANGDLDKAIIRRYIKRNISKVQYCYEKQLLAKPKLSGTVSTQFFIRPDGIVASANAAGVDPLVSSCVADVLKSIEFPKPKGGGGVMVNYPFTFRFAGQTGPVAAAPKLPPMPTPDLSVTEPPPPPPPVQAESKRPVPARAPEYIAGLDNPLAPIEGAMKDCLAKQSKAYGAFVVDLTFDPTTNGVTSAKPVGLDAATAACIATAAKTVSRVKAGAAALRCGVSFGDMPITDVPTIRITDKDLTFNGVVVDHPKAVFLDTSESPRIAALGEAIDAWARPLAPTAETVPVRGPGLLEAIDATPMRVVSRVIETALASNADFVLASQVSGTWRPLRLVHVPAAPVPVGTGRAWSFIPNGQAKGTPELVVASVVVTQNQIWVGLSRIDEFVEVPGRDWAKLETILAEHKASAFFADRIDLEIAADDAVLYGDVVKVIEIAAKTGFIGWHVVPPARITAKPSL